MSGDSSSDGSEADRPGNGSDRSRDRFDRSGDDSNRPENRLPQSDRRSLLKLGGSGALAVGLAGCQSTKNPLPGSNLRVDDGTDPDPDPVDGVDTEGPFAGQTVNIGVLAPMNLPLGESMWKAAQMAATELNESGGILGARIQVKLGDTETSPGTAQAEHRRLTTQEDCYLTVGTFLGAALLQTLTSVANQERLHITTASADPRVGKLVSRTASGLTDADPEEEYERFKYHFRAGPIHLLDLADAMYEFIETKQAELGWERAALLVENISEFNPAVERLKARLPELIELPVTERPGGISDWSPIFNEIESEDCDVALVGLALEGTTAVNQWAQQERDFEFGGIHVFAQSFDYWESTNGNVEHVFTMNAMTPQTENTPATQPFVHDYIDRFDEVPVYTGPITYDAITLMEQAVEAYVEGEGVPDELPHADEIIPYIEQTTFTGSTILEDFQFTSPDAEYAHEPLWTSMAETGVPVFQQWQYDPEVREDYGTMHAFAPEQNKTADRTIPEWIDDR